MKRLITFVLLVACVAVSRAEDVIQVVPFETRAGVTTDDIECFSIEMRNSEKMLAFQFDILLPEGMTFDNTDGLDPFEFNEDRVSYTVDRRGNKTFDYLAEYSDPFDGGWITVTVFTLEAEGELIGYDGEILRVYYLTDENMKSGIYPVRIRNTVFVNADNKKSKPTESTSYITIGESPLRSEETVSLKELTSYVPSFTVEAINSQMAANSLITLLDLSAADSLGAVPVMGNKNGFVKLSETAAGKPIMSAAVNIITSNGESATCANLSLTDGDWAFCSPMNFSATKASFNRVFKGGLWSTVCLPFNVSAEQLAQIKARGAEVERLVSYNAATQVLRFEAVDEMFANTPYIVKSETDCMLFSDFSDVVVVASDVMSSVECEDLCMTGVFSTTILNSDASNCYYGFDSVDGDFVRINSNGKAYPFRAYVMLPSSIAAAKRICVEHGNGELTGVKSLNGGNNATFTEVYTVDGRLIRKVNAKGSLEDLAPGVYIVAGRKVLID